MTWTLLLYGHAARNVPLWQWRVHTRTELCDRITVVLHDAYPEWTELVIHSGRDVRRVVRRGVDVCTCPVSRRERRPV
jgi:hypothetical protein